MAKKENLSQSLIEKAEEEIKKKTGENVIPLGMSTFLVKKGNHQDLKKVLGDNDYELNGEIEDYDVVNSLDPL